MSTVYWKWENYMANLFTSELKSTNFLSQHRTQILPAKEAVLTASFKQGQVSTTSYLFNYDVMNVSPKNSLSSASNTKQKEVRNSRRTKGLT